MWIRYWGLARDPFAKLGSPYVSLPSHDEAVARVEYAVEAGQSHVVIRAAAGLGKTTVLRRAIGLIRDARRRIIVLSGPVDAANLVHRIAEGLGGQAGQQLDLAHGWRSVERAIRVLFLEGCHVVLAIDDCLGHDGPTGDIVPALLGLGRLCPRDNRGIAVVETRGCDRDQSPIADDRWVLHAGLKPLTRSESEDYLHQKLAAAGCREPVFAPRAITRLQSLCVGIPRGLERLAALSLAAGATRGLKVISPDIVDGVASDWLSGRGSISSLEQTARSC